MTHRIDIDILRYLKSEYGRNILEESSFHDSAGCVPVVTYQTTKREVAGETKTYLIRSQGTAIKLRR